MVIALGIGVTMSTRYVQTLKQRVGQDASNRALAVAEAGVERMLNTDYETLLDYINFNNCGSACSLDIVGADGVTANAAITLAIAGGSSDPHEINLELNSVVEVNMEGYPNSTDIYICWDSPATGDLPSITGYIIKGGEGNYGMGAFSINSLGSLYGDNGFTDATSSLGYTHCATINSSTDPDVLRIRALYNGVRAYVIPSGGATLPSQGILITSLGTVLDSEKTVEVLMSNPYLPTPFDYVLYQKSEDNPLSN